MPEDTNKQWGSDTEANAGSANNGVSELPSISDEPTASQPANDSADSSARPTQPKPLGDVSPAPAADKPPQPVVQPQMAVKPATASNPLQKTAPTPSAAAQPAKKLPLVHLVIEVLLVLIIAGLAYWALTLKQDNKDLTDQVSRLNANPQIAVQKQTDQIIASVGKLMDLPTNEQPTVADVTDAAQAKKDSAFFANAQNGDKVLLYAKAGKAILYRPDTNKIVLVAPLTFNAQTGTNGGAATSTSTQSTTKPTR